MSLPLWLTAAKPCSAQISITACNSLILRLKIQHMSLLKCTLLTVLFTLLHSAAFAQLPAGQEFLIQTELDKRGLSAEEADAALISNGLDVKKMSPDEALSKKSQISAVLDELATAKNRFKKQSSKSLCQKIPQKLWR